MIKYKDIVPLGKDGMIVPVQPERRTPEPKAPRTREVAVVDKPRVSGVQPLDLAAAMKEAEDQFNPAVVLDRTAAALKYYARFPEPADLVLTTLWVAGTHWRNISGKLAFRVWPVLMVIAEPDSGKTRVLEEIQALAYNPSDIESFPTQYAVREMLEHDYTVILDEAHRLFGNGNSMRQLQAYLTAYKMGAGSSNARGGGLNSKSIYGAKALAALPSILDHTNGALEDLFTRGLPVITMKRSHDKIPDQDNDWDLIMTGMRNQLAEFGARNMPVPTEQNPNPTLWPIHTVDDDLSSRARELAKSYFAIADRAEDTRYQVMDGMTGEQKSEVLRRRARWAVNARRAVAHKVAGKGETGPEIIAQLQERMKALGIKEEEEL